MVLIAGLKASAEDWNSAEELLPPWTLSPARDLLEATQGPRCKREHRLQRLSSLAVGPVREG